MNRMIRKAAVVGAVAAATLAACTLGAGAANAATVHEDQPSTFQSSIVFPNNGQLYTYILDSTDTSTGVAAAGYSKSESAALSAASTVSIPTPGTTGEITNNKGQCLSAKSIQFGNMIRPYLFPVWESGAACVKLADVAQWTVDTDGYITNKTLPGSDTGLFADAGPRASLGAVGHPTATGDPRFQAALAEANAAE